MTEKIKERLDEFLEFDSNILFFNPLIRVFGGSIRDSIANLEIHDIDIMCGSKSVEALESILLRQGYKHVEDLLTSLEIGKIYSEINVISQPRTWVKNAKTIQLIRPVPKSPSDDYIENFHNLLCNVDISACGVSYSVNKFGIGVLYENYNGAISHCLSKVFKVNKSATMYIEKRIINRTSKLCMRGWTELGDNKIDIRDEKLNLLINDIDFDYKPEYEVKKVVFSYPKKKNILDDDDIYDLF